LAREIKIGLKFEGRVFEGGLFTLQCVYDCLLLTAYCRTEARQTTASTYLKQRE